MKALNITLKTIALSVALSVAASAASFDIGDPAHAEEYNSSMQENTSNKVQNKLNPTLCKVAEKNTQQMLPLIKMAAAFKQMDDGMGVCRLLPQFLVNLHDITEYCGDEDLDLAAKIIQQTKICEMKGYDRYGVFANGENGGMYRNGDIMRELIQKGR